LGYVPSKHRQHACVSQNKSLGLDLVSKDDPHDNMTLNVLVAGEA